MSYPTRLFRLLSLWLCSITSIIVPLQGSLMAYEALADCSGCSAYMEGCPEEAYYVVPCLEAAPSCCTNYCRTRLSYFLEAFGAGVWGDSPGVDDDYFSLGAACYADCLRQGGFVDARGHWMDEDNIGANFGAGVGQWWRCMSGVAYCYLDLRYIDDHVRTQIAPGVQGRWGCTVVRLNGYFPLGNRLIQGGIQVFDGYEGGHIIHATPLALTLSSVSGEVARFYDLCGVLCEVGANVYSLDSKYCSTKFGVGAHLDIGGRCCFPVLSFRIWSDPFFRTTAQVALRIALRTKRCGRSRSCLDWTGYDRVRRNDWMMLLESCRYSYVEQ